MTDISFKTLLWDLAWDAGRVPDPAAGGTSADFTTRDRFVLTQRLNQAVDWLWNEVGPWWSPEDMLTGQQIELHEGGLVDASEIEQATFFSVWQSDPRNAPASTLPSRLRLPARRQSNGDLLVLNTPAETNVFVFYKTPVPVFTAVPVVSGTTYATNSIVWHEAGSGHVRKALTSSLGSTVANNSTWKSITLPSTFATVVKLHANYLRLLLREQLPENAGRLRQLMTEALDNLLTAQEDEPGDKPWLINYDGKD
jgi:hypothetical protein